MRRWKDTTGLLEPLPLTAPVIHLLGEMVPGDPRRDLVREAYDLGSRDGRAELLGEQAERKPQRPMRASIPASAHDSFCAYLHEARRRDGFSAYSLAAAVGVDASYVHRMETGERPPANVELIQAMARVLHLSTLEGHQLLTLAGHAVPRYWLRALDLVHETSELLDPEDLAKFTDVVETICQLWKRRI